MKLAKVATAERKFYRALFPRERYTPSQWAERERVLGDDESSEPGPYSFDRTPYWRTVCDAIQWHVDEIVCLKGAQVGWSELCRNVLGFCIDVDPGPCMVLMPDQRSAENFRDERITPLVNHTPAIARHMPGRAWDATKHRIVFDTMSVFFVWAGSKSGTKSRPIRYLICEEPDEYPPFSSSGGDPLSKAEKRLTTYLDKGRSRSLIGGTPTTRAGNVFKRWDLCTAKYHFWVPCPHCNGFQELKWKQVKWPDLGDEDRAKKAERILADSLAYYECEHCKKDVRDHHKPAMLRRGLWATEDQVVTADGRVVGPAPKARRIGFYLPSTYSPWVSFSRLAHEWLLAQDDPQSLADFINQRLAEPFEEQRSKTDPSVVTAKAVGAAKGRIVPAWAKLLVATADTQGNSENNGHFWWTVRAWDFGYRSQLVDFGVASTRDELLMATLGRLIPVESGGAVTPATLLIDSGGGRWQEVYQFSQSDLRIHPTKGASHRQTWMVEEKPQKSHGVVLWLIDTEQAKDLLYQLIHDPDRGRWAVHNEITAEYARQMGAEAKVYDPTKNQSVWTEVLRDSNHLWDCEAIQVAAAWKFGMGVPPPIASESVDPMPVVERNPIYAHRGRW